MVRTEVGGGEPHLQVAGFPAPINSGTRAMPLARSRAMPAFVEVDQDTFVRADEICRAMLDVSACSPRGLCAILDQEDGSAFADLARALLLSAR